MPVPMYRLQRPIGFNASWYNQRVCSTETCIFFPTLVNVMASPNRSRATTGWDAAVVVAVAVRLLDVTDFALRRFTAFLLLTTVAATLVVVDDTAAATAAADPNN